MVCVALECLGPNKQPLGEQIWNDRGGGAPKDGAFFAQPGGTGLFRCSDDDTHNRPHGEFYLPGTMSRQHGNIPEETETRHDQHLHDPEKAAEFARALGLNVGGAGHPFVGNWQTKGFYAYRSGKYSGIAYFGSGGSEHERLAYPSESEKYRPWNRDDPKIPEDIRQKLIRLEDRMNRTRQPSTKPLSRDMLRGENILVSEHSLPKYNGIYTIQNNEINGKPWFKNNSGCILYFYNANSGGGPSWSLDDRSQDGTNDWFRGGWIEPPNSGGPPLGTRRWEGAGTIKMESVSIPDESGEPILNSDQKYVFAREEGGWHWHDERARAMGGNLASITSAEENEQVTRIANGNVVWIGGIRKGSGNGPGANHWYWSDGRPWTYTNWHPGEPNNYGGVENRVQLGLGAARTWNDVHEGWSGPAVYELSAETSPATTSVEEKFEFVPVSDYDEVWNDSGSGAQQDVSVWRPRVPVGCHLIGMTAKNGHSPPNFSTLVIRAGGSDIAPPERFDLVWWQERGKRRFWCWRPIPPPGYVSLGDVGTISEDPPSRKDVVCVALGCLSPNRQPLGGEIWNDRGGGAPRDAAFFEQPGGTGLFRCSDDATHNKPHGEFPLPGQASIGLPRTQPLRPQPLDETATESNKRPAIIAFVIGIIMFGIGLPLFIGGHSPAGEQNLGMIIPGAIMFGVGAFLALGASFTLISSWAKSYAETGKPAPRWTWMGMVFAVLLLIPSIPLLIIGVISVETLHHEETSSARLWITDADGMGDQGFIIFIEAVPGDFDNNGIHDYCESVTVNATHSGLWMSDPWTPQAKQNDADQTRQVFELEIAHDGSGCDAKVWPEQKGHLVKLGRACYGCMSG